MGMWSVRDDCFLLNFARASASSMQDGSWTVSSYLPSTWSWTSSCKQRTTYFTKKISYNLQTIIPQVVSNSVFLLTSPVYSPSPLVTFLLCAHVCARERGIQYNLLFLRFNIHIHIVEPVNHGVLTIVGEIRCYRNGRNYYYTVCFCLFVLLLLVTKH